MEKYEKNRVKWLIDKPEGLFLTRRRRSLRRAGSNVAAYRESIQLKPLPIKITPLSIP